MENISDQKTINSEKSTSIPNDNPKQILQDAENVLINNANLNDEQQKFIQDRLYKMIDYTVKRQDWYADQCHRLLQIGLGLIASSVAIIALFSKVENLSGISELLAYLLGLSIFFTGLRLVYLYNIALAGDHPYRKSVNITSWYFAYKFSEDFSQNLDKKDPLIARKQIDQEANNIKNYFSEFLTHAKDKLSVIREDIEQVSILLILQKYKHSQTKQMSKNLSSGLIITTVFLLLFLVSLVVFPYRASISITAIPTSTTSVTVSTTTPSSAPSATFTQTNIPSTTTSTLSPNPTPTP